MISYDLALDSNNDLTIENGDWAILQTDDQNIEAILMAVKGQFYQNPLLGYGLIQRLQGPFTEQQENRDIREELKRDNYDVTDLVIEDDFTIYVDAVKKK